MIKEIVTKIRILWAMLTGKIYEITFYNNYDVVVGYGLRIYKYETRGQKQFWLVYDGEIKKVPVYKAYVEIYKLKKEGAFISIGDTNFFINANILKSVFVCCKLKANYDELYLFSNICYGGEDLFIYNENCPDTFLHTEVEKFKYLKNTQILFVRQEGIWHPVIYSTDEMKVESIALDCCPKDTDKLQIVENKLIRIQNRQVIVLGEYDKISKISWLGKNVYVNIKNKKTSIIKIDEKNEIFEAEISGYKILPIKCFGEDFVRYFITENKGDYKVTIYEIKDKDSMEIVEVKTYEATKVSFDTPYFDKETGEFVQKLLFNVIRSVNEM